MDVIVPEIYPAVRGRMVCLIDCVQLEIFARSVKSRSPVELYMYMQGLYGDLKPWLLNECTYVTYYNSFKKVICYFNGFNGQTLTLKLKNCGSISGGHVII